MRIGFVSTWFERGAAHVTKQYIKLLENNNEIFVYARGGEQYATGNKEWDKSYVTWGIHLGTVDEIKWGDFKKWILKNNLDVIFFNEQRDIDIVLKIKMNFPNIKLGSYIDYYRQDTISEFKVYDFLICNTKRHYEVFKWHKQAYYVRWGTDVDLYKFQKRSNDILTFFHSAGMSTRKGTSVLIDTFLNSDLKNNSKLIIHTQLPVSKFTKFNIKELKDNNIEIIEKTIKAPGIYYLGDVYVYPTELDGLGLTIYEALSSGLPVVATNVAPINEIINSSNGKLIDVDEQFCRADAYYWPLSIVNKESLYKSMKYYVDNFCKIDDLKMISRECAEKKYNWNDREEVVQNIFLNSKKLHYFDKEEISMYNKKILIRKWYKLILSANQIFKIKIISDLILKYKSKKK
ncbi:glycosyltransferase [Clostridium perfringens]|uniref:glycosyltransferase n=1 Tax=Clostridium perfringens TaxID=1502 RepID=UPI00240F1E8D|nr:glycosyltransferase [Clostridium perfringens]WFD91117.1 glycosyltransferase [Clostridium perfringens]